MDQISKAAEFIADLRFALRQEPQIPEPVGRIILTRDTQYRRGWWNGYSKRTAAVRLGTR